MSSEPHEHGHDPHEHERRTSPVGWVQSMLKPHSHDAADSVDAQLESSARGIWALKISLLGLLATAGFQVVIVLISGSVALLADTIHNFSDALTAVPLWIAFALGRRAATSRYTYGYGRAEDLAGLFIVVMIALSAGIAGWESVQRLADPQPIANLGWVIVAAIVGFTGNEAVAVFRIRVGNEIGSAALIADGHHARADGFTSLAVLIGAVGVLAGFPLADPIVGVGITVAILFVLKQAAVQMWHRLMDAADPAVVEQLTSEAAAVEGVQEVDDLRVRWLGHRLEADMRIVVDEDLPTRESHRLAEQVRHRLFHAQPKLASIIVHVDPCGHSGGDLHRATAHHRPASTRPS
ncbi:MAG: cation transporter [Chloroflexi bacterium]|nr:cation transporter [Chloroflexota bacterium]